ncbi:zinc finger matrin-type protein 5-like [Acipenser oxyrinchus oxyrinchus]|uniref:Zinc finger matrin-type protein 5 n=1 Tax=Acipenser oxyrinchus oxyrinchus TaxID=40147 RepID=A0AAD8CXY0_ACIOX|nr:zinc finger matrin-type protein 5-like [Acipenser oxyrinchus oxyrinchus]
MGKRYLCDYCDRSFQDNMHNRKKHLNGVQHHRAKKAWFDLFRDAALILADEQAKKPCRKFLQTGQCVFGMNCRFSHLTEEDMERLKEQIEEERRAREDPREARESAERSIEDWLARREKRSEATDSSSILQVEGAESSFGSELPAQFMAFPDLPASLLPPPPGGWKDIPVTEWG